jgi:tetratricopeptide (TPR) repeat protein
LGEQAAEGGISFPTTTTHAPHIFSPHVSIPPKNIDNLTDISYFKARGRQFFYAIIKLREGDMKRTWVKIIVFALVLALSGSVAFAAKAKPPKEMDTTRMLILSFDMIEKKQYGKALKVLDDVLQKEPGNPLALNNKAAVMVQMKKFDKADTYLNEALPRARGYMVQVNRVCTVGGICQAFRPVAGQTGNQDLEPLIKMNLDMVKQMMSAEPLPGRGER